MSFYREIEIDSNDFSDDDILKEAKARQLDVWSGPEDVQKLLEKIWQKRRLRQDYQQELDDLLWLTLGKIS
jgi:hypothetical protein